MKRSPYVLIFSLFTLNCFCQDKPDIVSLTKITFLGPGISREIRIAPLQSVTLHAFMKTSAYFFYSDALGSEGGVYFDPALRAQYRYYYNAAKRSAKGKRTEMNSMNYVGGLLETVFTTGAYADGHLTEENRRPANTMGVMWGLQRNGQKHFSLDLNLGVGYFFARGTKRDEIIGSTYSSNISEITGIITLNLGFWLKKKN